MDKKIVALLNNNLRVIIPDFGAFIIRQQKPQIIAFNELLVTNDGLLIEYIMKTENVDKDIADQILSDYTTYALRTLESGNDFIINGLGTLRKEKNGKITFSQENDLIDLDEEKNDPVIEEESSLKVPLDSNVKNSEYKISDIVTESQKSQVNNEEVKEIQNSRNPGNFKVTFIPRHTAKWAIIILLANIGVFAYFLLRNKDNNGQNKNTSSMLIENAVIEQLNDSMMSAVRDTSKVLSNNNSQSSESDFNKKDIRYYIVAGCFRDEINADELVKTLKNMGYEAEKFGKIGELYAVSFSSYSDKEIAVKELAKIREDSYPDAWMTRF